MSNTIFTAENLLKAYFDCRKTKRQTVNALKYELDLEDNLNNLKEALVSRKYQPLRSICFVITVPKPREIFAAEFCDRITHHILINEVQKIWDKSVMNDTTTLQRQNCSGGVYDTKTDCSGGIYDTKTRFIDDSYACRKGKGHHYGVTRVAKFVRENAYYGQFDIQSFFSSINKDTLYNIFSKVILKQLKPAWWKDEVLWLSHVIIFNNPTQNYYYKGDPSLKKFVPAGKSLFDQNEDVGMPIGNLTSQFFANVYLNELDHFVKETLGCNAYGRYVDDFLIFSNNKCDITNWRNRINLFLSSQLHLKMHPRKQQIQPTRHGVPFVGYFIKPWGVTVRRNVVKAAKNKIYGFNLCGDLEHVVSSLNSYFGHFDKANSSHLRKHLVKDHLSLRLKIRLVVVGNWHHLRIVGCGGA